MSLPILSVPNMWEDVGGLNILRRSTLVALYCVKKRRTQAHDKYHDKYDKSQH